MAVVWNHQKEKKFRSSLSIIIVMSLKFERASQVAQTVKDLPAMWETWVWSLNQEDILEKGMATHSSSLAWRIPWTEEPGRLQSIGLQKRHRVFEQLTFSLFKIQSHKDYKKSLADNDTCHLLDRLPKSQGKRTADSLIQQLLAKHLLSACHWRTCLVVQWHSQCKRPGFDPWLGN